MQPFYLRKGFIQNHKAVPRLNTTERKGEWKCLRRGRTHGPQAREELSITGL